MEINKFDKLSRGRQELVSIVLENLEKDINPWVKKWKGISTSPVNAVTNVPYKGINNTYLSMIGDMKGYGDPRWATFTQIQKKGWHLRAGSKGSPIEVIKYHDYKTKKELDWDKFSKMSKEEQKTYWKENVRFIIQSFTVFNASMIEGIEPYKEPVCTEEDLHIRAEKILNNSPAKVFNNGGDRAYYRPSTDTIHLPVKAAFGSLDDYYAVALHEIGHSTGHQTRLARDMSGMFGSDAYAREELVAEICSMFVKQDIDFSLTNEHLNNHSAYIKSWAKKIKEDPNYLFEAISKAAKAADFVLSYESLSVKAAPKYSSEKRFKIKSQVEGWEDWYTDAIKNNRAREAAEWLIENNYENEDDVKKVFYNRQTSDMSDDFDAEKNDDRAIIRVANEYKARQAQANQIDTAEKARQVGQAQQVNEKETIRHDNLNYSVVIYPVLGPNTDTVNDELKEYVYKPLDIQKADTIIEKISKKYGIDYEYKPSENGLLYLVDDRSFSLRFGIMSRKDDELLYKGTVDNADDQCGILRKMKITEATILESEFFDTMEKEQARYNLEVLIPSLELEKSKIEQGQQVRQGQQVEQAKWQKGTNKQTFNITPDRRGAKKIAESENVAE